MWYSKFIDQNWNKIRVWSECQVWEILKIKDQNVVKSSLGLRCCSASSQHLKWYATSSSWT